jgi:hypothetical protein
VRRHMIVMVLSLAMLFIASPDRAAAKDPGPRATGNAGDPGATVTASNGTGDPGPLPRDGGHGGGGNGASCAYIPRLPKGTSSGDGLSDPGSQNGVPGQYYDSYCNGVYTGTVFVPKGTGGPIGSVVNPVQLAQQATDHAPFNPLAIVMSPPAGREAVNFPIFLSISGYSPVTASASASGVTSTVSIVPSSVRWQMGDGHTVTCQGPGVPYDPTRPFSAELPAPCGYKYSASSANQPGQAFQVTATVHYTATWTVTGAPGGGSLAPIDRSVSLPVTVGEIQIVNQ